MMFAISMPNFLPDDLRSREKRDSFVKTWKTIAKDSPVPIVILAMNDPDQYLKSQYDADHLYVLNCRNLPLIPARIVLDEVIKDVTGINYVLGIDDDFSVKPMFIDWMKDIIANDKREFFQLCASSRYLFTALANSERCYDGMIERVNSDRKRIPAGTKLWETYHYNYFVIAPKYWTKEGYLHRVGQYQESIEWLRNYFTMNQDEKGIELFNTIMYVGSDDILLVLPQAYQHGFDIDKVRGLKHETARSDTKDPAMFNYSTVPKFNEAFPDINVTTQMTETVNKSSKLTYEWLEKISDMSLIREIYQDPSNSDTLKRLRADFNQAESAIRQ